MSDHRQRETREHGGPEPDRPEEIVRDFHALRNETQTPGRVPPFDEMWGRARKTAAEEGGARGEDARRSLRRLGRWAPLAAAAAVAGVLLVGLPGDDDEREFERLVASYSQTAGTWRSPTASLMDIPGVDLGAVPSFGSSAGGLDALEPEPEEGRDS